MVQQRTNRFFVTDKKIVQDVRVLRIFAVDSYYKHQPKDFNVKNKRSEQNAKDGVKDSKRWKVTSLENKTAYQTNIFRLSNVGHLWYHNVVVDDLSKWAVLIIK